MADHKERATITLIINGEQAKTSLKEVRQAQISLERELSKMKKADDPAGFEKLTKELHATKRAHAQMVQEIRGGEASWNKFKLNIKDIALGTLGGNFLTFLSTQVLSILPNAIEQTGKLSDQLSDIRKQTGMTADEVDQLNGRLSEINTRTPREELRALAAEAGKLGYESVKDVEAYVKAANMLNVALGEDLGEGATKEIAKINTLFKLSDIYGVEGAMLRVGSSINEIGKASTASEAYIVDFVKRMSGLAGVANVSVQELIALGGTLDSLGQTSEVSSTALNKLLVKMGGDVPKFAKMAKVSVDDFRKTMERSAVDGLMLVLKEVGKTTSGIEELSGVLDDLGLDGGRVVAVLGTLANNTAEYDRQLGIATRGLEEGTSITNEYNLKNENTAAIIEKLGKKFTSYFMILKGGLDPVIHLFGKWFGVVDELEEKVGQVIAQQEKLANTEKNLLPLVDRYDILAGKVKKTKEEQEEFAKITKQLADAVPGAVTQWDAYGNAMGVNTWKVRDFATEQRKLLEVMRLQRQEMAKEELAELKREQVRVQTELSRGSVQSYSGMGQYQNLTLRDKDIATRTKRLAEIQARIKKINDDVDRLDGKVIPGEAAPVVPLTPPAAGGSGAGGGSGKPAKVSKEEKAAVKNLDDVRDELLKIRQQIVQDALTEDAKQIQAAQFKYGQLREKAKGHAKEIAEIDALEKQEIAAIRERSTKKDLAEFDKQMRAELKAMNKAADEKNAFQQKLDDMADEQRFGEVAKVESKYAALITQAEAYGLETIELYTMMAEEINLIRQKNAAKEIETEGEKHKKIADIEKKALEDGVRNIEEKRLALSSIADTIGNIFLILADNEKDYTEFKKAIGLVQLAIDTGAAIAAGIKTAAASVGNPFALIATIATTTAVITGNILKAKQLITGSEVPTPPAFRAGGGSTSLAALAVDRGGAPEGWVNRPTLFSMGKRSYVAGEAGAEYVLSNAMLQNPVVADFAGMVEGLRQQNAFARNPQGAIGRAASSGPSMDPQLAETNRLLREMLSRTGFNYAAFEDYRDLVDGVRARAAA